MIGKLENISVFILSEIAIKVIGLVVAFLIILNCVFSPVLTNITTNDISTFSEIVVTIECNGELFGVIDIDSPISARFDEEDRYGLEMVSRAVSDILEKLISSNKK